LNGVGGFGTRTLYGYLKLSTSINTSKKSKIVFMPVAGYLRTKQMVTDHPRAGQVMINAGGYW